MQDQAYKELQQQSESYLTQLLSAGLEMAETNPRRKRHTVFPKDIISARCSRPSLALIADDLVRHPHLRTVTESEFARQEFGFE